MKLTFLLFTSTLAAETKLLGVQTRRGSYWNGFSDLESVPSECRVEPGIKVPDICCTSDTEVPLRSDFTPFTCSNLAGFLPDDPTLGLINYLNCDDGVAVYAEGCYEGGANGGIVPPGAYESNDAASVGDCGTKPPCSFIVEGQGCWKIRDTSDLPGYEDVPDVAFLWMDIPTCETEEEPEEEPKDSPKLLGAQTRPGSYWNTWPDLESTPSECRAEPGNMVPEICCTADAEVPLRSDFTPDTCSNLVGLLPNDPTLGVVNYLNCDDGVEVYAEGCYEGGASGGIVPAGGYESNNATSVGDCGTKPPCSFIVEGKGCWKIRDTSDLPGYEDVPDVVFLWMDIPTCKAEEEPESAGGSVRKHWASLFVGLLAFLL